MKFATLTRPDGKLIYVNPEIIYAIEDAVGGSALAKSQLIHSGGSLFVRETIEEVKTILEGE